MRLPEESFEVLDESCNEIDIDTDTSSDVISILDRRNDGASIYYRVLRRSSNDGIPVWELEDKLDCSKRKIEKFNALFRQKQKLRQKKRRAENRAATRNTFMGRILICACVKDSPIDLNRSFRGSICDIN